MVRRLSLESDNFGLQVAPEVLVDVEDEGIRLHLLALGEIHIGGSLDSNSSCLAETKRAFTTVFISIHPF